jgi:predicted Zn-dependent protease
MIRKAVDDEPQNAAYRDSLGWVLFRLGRTGEAVAELEKAVADDADPTILEHLAEAYRAAGQVGKAKDAWRRAAEAHEKSGAPEKARVAREKSK